jgi:hypothetical protein
MFSRMIQPLRARTGARATLIAAALAAGLVPGCKEAAVDGITDKPARLGAQQDPTDRSVVRAGTVAAVTTRTVHFSESARRIRAHPALGPHTPAEIKRRAAVLVEPIRLATPPTRVVVSEARETAAPEARATPPSETRTQFASLATMPALPTIAAQVARAPVAPAPEPEPSQRSAPRNVVIPMVVSSSGGGTWRAEGGEKGSGNGNAHCRADALAQLKQLSATGYRIYERIADKKMFTTWILCDDRQRGLTTAVHEAVHMLTEQLDAYPLIDGGQIKRIRALEKFVKPGRIAAQFKASDDFVKTYLLPGGASSADDFTYLLDEFNSYVHDLNTAVQTQTLAPKNTRLGHRDGMAALMTFVMAYVEYAEKQEPRTWAGLHRPDVKHLVTTLWSEAERTIESSCKVPRYAVDDQAFLRHICKPSNGRALGHMLGRAPRCPNACLSGVSG